MAIENDDIQSAYEGLLDDINAPKSVETDAGRIEKHSLPDRLATIQAVAAHSVAGGSSSAIRRMPYFRRMRMGGTV